ncbi:MAG: TonB-dependent receptor [Mariniphaga sp.]|nr:TonB-dependent receptor [Mariniphaga sp.]
MEKKHLKGFLPLFMFAVIMAFSTGAWAQQKTINGTVTDDTGSPLPGVTIVVQGTTTGTVTNVDGVYQLEVPESANVLVFSYIGMLRQVVEIGSQTTINVSMRPDVIGVDEVVVVGYGTRLKEELTGAVSSISEEALQISNAPSVMSRLQGQVSGVTITSANRPGGDATIRIRGIGTINDPNPLYIIDGVPSGPGNNINPNDIESISILKDASSAAIYGTRGANGVVIITTKRGRANMQPAINFSVKTGVTQATNQYDMLNTKEYADAVWLSLKNRNMELSHAQYGTGQQPVIPDYILPAGAKMGEVDENNYSFYDNLIFRANKEGTDWYDEIYRNGMIKEYDLSVRGGGQNSTYSFSGNYLDEDGFIIHTNFKRYSFRMNSEAKFNDWFKAGESLQVVYIDEYGNLGDNSEGTVISQAYRAQPIIPVYDIAGNFAGSRAPTMGNAANPVSVAYRARNNNGKYVRILGNAFAEITFMEGLTLRSLFGYNWGQWNYKGYSIPNPEFSEPQLVNGMNASSNYSLQWNWSNTLNYNATFDGIHRLNVVLGTEAIENTYQSLNASRRSYFSEDPLYMQLDSGESNRDNSGNGSSWSLFSVFGRVNYDLMGKYFLEVTARRDGSSRFSAANRYGTFPAASAAWAISEEDFMAGTGNWLDLMKVRVGWGMSGNDRIGNYNSFSTFRSDAYRSSYALDGSNTGTISGFMPSTLGNEDVTWETTQTFNLGLDGTFLDRRLSASIDLWQRNTSDMLYRLPLPQVMGDATPPFVNIAEMVNKGFDFELGYTNTAMDGDFRYSVKATVSRYKNEVTKLGGEADDYFTGQFERQKEYTRVAVGHAFPEFFGYETVGIFQTEAEAAGWPTAIGADGTYNQPGHFKFVDQLTVDTDGDGIPDATDGVITSADRTFIGSPHPDFTGGLNIDLGYGNFDLNMFFYGSYGNDMINYVTRWIDYGQFNGGLSKDALYNSWGSPHLSNNADAKLPMLDYSDISQEASSAFIEDGSYLRLKTLRLGYSVPQSLLNRAQIKNLGLYVQVSNLFTLTKYGGLDPEVNSSGVSMGLDRGAWPTPRQVMFGVNLGL